MYRYVHFHVLFQFTKPQKIDFEPKYKKKGRSKAGNIEKRKQKVHLDENRGLIRESIQHKEQEEREKVQERGRKGGQGGVLDRFRAK